MSTPSGRGVPPSQIPPSPYFCESFHLFGELCHLFGDRTHLFGDRTHLFHELGHQFYELGHLFGEPVHKKGDTTVLIDGWPDVEKGRDGQVDWCKIMMGVPGAAHHLVVDKLCMKSLLFTLTVKSAL